MFVAIALFRKFCFLFKEDTSAGTHCNSLPKSLSSQRNQHVSLYICKVLLVHMLYISHVPLYVCYYTYKSMLATIRDRTRNLWSKKHLVHTFQLSSGLKQELPFSLEQTQLTEAHLRGHWDVASRFQLGCSPFLLDWVGAQLLLSSFPKAYFLHAVKGYSHFSPDDRQRAKLEACPATRWSTPLMQLQQQCRLIDTTMKM